MGRKRVPNVLMTSSVKCSQKSFHHFIRSLSHDYELYISLKNVSIWTLSASSSHFSTSTFLNTQKFSRLTSDKMKQESHRDNNSIRMKLLVVKKCPGHIFVIYKIYLRAWEMFEFDDLVSSYKKYITTRVKSSWEWKKLSPR
jgi:hypothetical protein